MKIQKKINENLKLLNTIVKFEIFEQHGEIQLVEYHVEIQRFEYHGEIQIFEYHGEIQIKINDFTIKL